MSRPKVLIVEDDVSLREALSDTLQVAGYSVFSVADGMAALNMLESEKMDVVVSDVQMTPMDGHTLLKEIKKSHVALPVILMTAYGTIQKAVEAMHDGATDYLVKPFEIDAMINLIERHVVAPHDNEAGLIAEDPQTLHLVELAKRVANTDATVMIGGESGTGKEVFARFIHNHSKRSKGPFVAINCAAIPENMLEALLFGYEKGAFTGAEKVRKGLFEAAHQGTLFLDEIGDMPRSLQGKLLRTLQEGEVRRLGSTDPIKVQVRIVTATNQQIETLVAQGILRDDLFYRLNVVRISIPPLRQRRDDIVPLAHHFLDIYRKRAQKEITGFAPEAIQAMLNHPWPGNVRELENAVERGVILARSSSITPQDLSLGLPLREGGSGGTTTLKELERHHILSVLERHGGNQARAARELGIGRNTLWRRLKKYGLLP